MKKKLTLVVTCVVLVAAMVIGGTLAYFTDNDKATNTFTVGNVDIKLLESQYHRVNAGRGYTTATEPLLGGYLWASNVKLEGNAQNTPNYVTSGETWQVGDANGEAAKDTGFFSDAQIEADAETYKNAGGYFDTHANKMVPGSNVRKNPYVKNIGTNDAYVRVRVLVPVSLFAVIDGGPSYWVSTAMNEGQVTSKAVEAYNAAGNKATNVELVERNDNIKYYEFDFTYTKALKGGELTFWNVWSNIAIDKNATAEDLANVESFDVIIEADAIQAEGFANATEAFAAFDGK